MVGTADSGAGSPDSGVLSIAMGGEWGWWLEQGELRVGGLLAQGKRPFTQSGGYNLVWVGLGRTCLKQRVWSDQGRGDTPPGLSGGWPCEQRRWGPEWSREPPEAVEGKGRDGGGNKICNKEPFTVFQVIKISTSGMKPASALAPAAAPQDPGRPEAALLRDISRLLCIIHAQLQQLARTERGHVPQLPIHPVLHADH